MKKFLHNRSGATTIEYAVICTVIFLAIILGIAAVGTESTNKWTSTSDEVSDAMGGN